MALSTWSLAKAGHDGSMLGVANLQKERVRSALRCKSGEQALQVNSVVGASYWYVCGIADEKVSWEETQLLSPIVYVGTKRKRPFVKAKQRLARS